MQETLVLFLDWEDPLRRNRLPTPVFWGASLVVQLVKNPPAMRQTWVQSLGWEDPLEKGKATHSSILAWRIPWAVQSMGLQSQTQLSDFHLQTTDQLFRFIYEF